MAGTALLDVANAAPSFSFSGHSFLVLQPLVHSVSPRRGPTHGGTVVTLSGGPFHPSFCVSSFCQIDSQLVPLHFISSENLACTTLPHAGSVVSLVSLHFDGVQLPTTFVFSYLVKPSVYSIEPRLGPIAGGTIVTVFGHGFEAVHHAFCYFDQTQTTAVPISANQLVCTSPPRKLAGQGMLRVATTSSYQRTKALIFAVEPQMELFSLKPTAGPPDGSTTVVAHGRHFSLQAWQLGLLACRFNQTCVLAEHLSSNQLQCITPTYEEGLVPIELTSNRQQFTRVGLLFYFVVASIQAVRPSSGPIRGGSSVMVRVIGHVASSSTNLLCHFGLTETACCPQPFFPSSPLPTHSHVR